MSNRDISLNPRVRCAFGNVFVASPVGSSIGDLVIRSFSHCIALQQVSEKTGKRGKKQSGERQETKNMEKRKTLYNILEPPAKGADSWDAGGRHVEKGEEEREKKHCTPWNAVSCLWRKTQIQGSNLSEKFINIHVSNLCPFCNRDPKITRKQAIPPHVADQLGGLNWPAKLMKAPPFRIHPFTDFPTAVELTGTRRAVM